MRVLRWVFVVSLRKEFYEQDLYSLQILGSICYYRCSQQNVDTNKTWVGVRSGPVFPCVGKIPGTKGCMLLGSDSYIATSKNSCTRDIYIIYVVPWNVRILPLIQQSLQVNSDISCISSRDWWILDNLVWYVVSSSKEKPFKLHL